MPETRTGRVPRRPRSRIRSTVKAALPLVAVIGRDGLVCGLFAAPTDVRSFLRGGTA